MRALLRALFGTWIAFFLLVYLPVGLVAVTAQEGWTEDMRSGMGVEAPLPLRLFAVLRAWTPWALVLLAIVVLAHVSLRRWLPRWAFLAPLLLVVLLVLAVGSGIVDRLLHGAGSDLPTAAVLIVAVALFVVLVAGALVARGLESRRFVFFVLAAAGLLVAFRIGADLWGHWWLSAYDAQWEKDVAAVRESRRTAERPVLRGAPVDEDAAPRYEALFDAVRPAATASAGGQIALSRAAREAPFAPIPEDARQTVSEHRKDLDALREAQQRRDCALGLEFDPGEASKRPLWSVARWPAAALVVEGHIQAQAGDLEGAADRYLEAVRFGGDMAPGPWVNALVGTSVEEIGLRALGRLVLSGKLDRALLARIEEDRAKLEPARASIADGWNTSRLFLGHMEHTMNAHPEEAGLQKPAVLAWVLPYRAVAALAVATVDPLQRQLGAALAAGDVAAWKRAADATRARAGTSLNPMARYFMGYSGPFAKEGSATARVPLMAQRSLAWFRLVQAAVMAESRGDGGSRGQGDALRLPDDPLASGSALRWSRGRSGTRIWSVGIDGKDDGGESKNEEDLVLE
jgi:hypothetical protein